ncbi:MAG: cyclomaltodextrinase N-terminal domain-containing protein, partial [Candidatus Marinimicrobia bacterium]|nr:cyclomaltodextrinase N-terminal domain-containing protein [Candidatus Neomarinimicrobiota bacterium]
MNEKGNIINKIILIFLTLGFCFNSLLALEITKVEPPSWWSGMEKDTIQLLIYGDDFTDYEINNSPKGIEIIDQKI